MKEVTKSVVYPVQKKPSCCVTPFFYDRIYGTLSMKSGPLYRVELYGFLSLVYLFSFASTLVD